MGTWAEPQEPGMTGPAAAPVPYAETVEDWLADLANRAKSPRTRSAYRSDLDDTMVSVAAELGLLPPRAELDAMEPAARELEVMRAFEVLDLGLVTFRHLRRAIAAFRQRPDPRYTRRPAQAPPERAPATVARRVAAVRTFFAWCYLGELLPADPAARLEPPRRPARLPRALDDHVAETVYDGAHLGSRWPERDVLIVALALAGGLRLGEIAGLRMSHLLGPEPEWEWLVVIGKGDKERRVPVTGPVREALAAYLPTRREHLDRLGMAAETVVVSSRKRQVRSPTGAVVGETVDASHESVGYVVDRILRHFGVKERQRRVHALRHTFATTVLREGHLNIRQLQQVLGHASLEMTQLYTKVGDEEVAAGLRGYRVGRR